MSLPSSQASRQRFLPYAPLVHSEAEMLRWAMQVLLPSGGVTLATVDRRVVGVLVSGSRGCALS